jgi:hypothetical protein
VLSASDTRNGSQIDDRIKALQARALQGEQGAAALRRIEMMPRREYGMGLSKLGQLTSYENICKKLARQHRTRQIAGKQLNGPKLLAIFQEVDDRFFAEMRQ